RNGRAGSSPTPPPPPATRSADLCLHRTLVPECDPIAVGILQLGAVAPEELLRRGVERDAARDEAAIRLVHVVDLEEETARRLDVPVGRRGDEARHAQIG